MLITTIGAVLWSISILGQDYNPDRYAAMKWRLIGPHRGGRVTAVAGIPGKPAIYYFGTPGGGVWKTTSGGRVWEPIFDHVQVASIGALALAPSNSNIIYVGTGEQTEGNGVYKSTDGGATWTNIGLRGTRSVSSIIVDPQDPNVVLVATYNFITSGTTRGVFRTTDGGTTWNRVLFKDDKTSIVDMCMAPNDAHLLYAAAYTFQLNPNDRRAPGTDSQIYRSTDEGNTWQVLGGAGLPEKARGRIGVAVAPGKGGRRIYAIMSQGLFRSDDGGDSWYRSGTDPRVIGSGYFSRVYVDPHNADIVYVMQTSMYRSTDGGKTFEAFKGAPSGEDQHVLWIAPDDSQRLFLGSDQGAVISVDGGRIWSSWFNQATGEMYHVRTDNSFPYHLYGSQQDAGSVVVPSRSDFGQITYRDWFSSGSFESGHIAPDPTNANLIYSIGWFGSVLRLDRTTGQISTVFAPGNQYRYTWETPLVFSPTDPSTLYLGMQRLLKTSDGAVTWQEISPDLTEKSASSVQRNHFTSVPEDAPQRLRTGVIQSIAPSAAKPGQIWVGTSTGLVQLTRDNGATWKDVTPRELPAASSVILIEASATEENNAYIITLAQADSRPYIYRTRDHGETWQKIVAGLPDRGIARVVREDPARKGLLYAGTETGVHVSFDGGDHWQSLQLNLPTVSVRDLAVHGSDLVAATYGRGLWILDNVSPIRQLDPKLAEARVILFRPEPAVRTRWDNHPDTPLPADTPAGQNPPDGGIIDYYLKSEAKEVALEIRDQEGDTVRRYSSKSPSLNPMKKNVPDYWFAPLDTLSSHKGLNRFVWNLQWPHPPTLPYSFYGRPLDYIEYTLPDHAVAGQTPRDQPPGPLAVPGSYEVVLTVDKQVFRQPLVLILDPRLHRSQFDLEAQLNLARDIDRWMDIAFKSYGDVSALRLALGARLKALANNSAAKDGSETAESLDKQLRLIADGTDAEPGFGSVNRDLARFVTMIQSGDLRPAPSARANAIGACEVLKKNLAGWRKINSEILPGINTLFEKYKLTPLSIVTPTTDLICPN